MIQVKRVGDVIGKKVYTDNGDFFGEVEEVNLVENKIHGWRIRVNGGIGSFLGGARGIIIPHKFVTAIGDVFVVHKSALPMQADSDLPDVADEL